MSSGELKHIESSNKFHNLGAHNAKDQSPYVCVFEDGSTRSPLLTDRKEYKHAHNNVPPPTQARITEN